MFQRCGFADADAEIAGCGLRGSGASLRRHCIFSVRFAGWAGCHPSRLFNFESYNHYYHVDLAKPHLHLGNMELTQPAYADATIKEGIALLPKAAIPGCFRRRAFHHAAYCGEPRPEEAQKARSACWCWTRTWTCARSTATPGTATPAPAEGFEGMLKDYTLIGIRSGCKEEFPSRRRTISRTTLLM